MLCSPSLLREYAFLLLPIDSRSLTIIFVVVANKQFTAPNFNLVYCEDLNRIVRFEIFLHKDEQLCAVHVILGYKPISFSFPSPKHVIKAKDPRLLLIDIVVPGFLASPPRKELTVGVYALKSNLFACHK